MAYIKKGGNGGRRPEAGGPRGPKQKTLDKFAAREAVQALARVYAAEALGVLLNVMRHGQSGAVRLSAAKEILDRAYGRPAQALVEANGGTLRAPTTVVHVLHP